MQRVLAILILSLLIAPALAEPEPAAAPEPEAHLLTLRDAARKGLLGVRGVDPSGYRQVTLELENRTDESLTVDLCASYLRPKKKGSCQRLGLGPAITPNVTKKLKAGTVIVDLAPRQKLSLRMNTVCLDAGRSCPGRQVFVASPNRLPEVREKVLRWWADHPDAPQGAVNSAIWSFREEVHIGPGVVPSYREPKGLFPAVRGGTYYQLRDGELTAIDPDGILRILGAQIFTVLPTSGAVYAVGLGGDGRPELWRLAMTGEVPWGLVTRIRNGERVIAVHPMAGGTLALVTDQGVLAVDGETRQTKHLMGGVQQKDLSVRRLNDRQLLAAARIPASRGFYQGGERKGESSDIFELWLLDVPAGRAEQLKRFWNVKAMSAGPAGIYGLTHKGLLRRLVNRSFKTMPGDESYERIIAVGRKLVWLASTDGRLKAVDAGTGKVRFAPSATTGSDLAFRIDEVTDDLAFVSPGTGSFHRVRAADGRLEDVQPGVEED